MSTSSTILDVRGISKRFNRGVWPVRRTITVPDGADLSVDRGELVGLVGENGSGKSTLMKIVVGLLDRDGGAVNGSGRLGYCPQPPLLWEKLTVTEHFAPFGRAYELAESEARTAGADLMAELEFDRYAGYRVEELSGGAAEAQPGAGAHA